MRAFVRAFVALVALVAVSAAPAQQCPTSGSSMHAGCETQLAFKDSCATVRDEITKRVGSQYEGWHDPHNNGTFSVISKTDGLFQLSRLTGDKKYTDKINFVFEDAGTGCNVAACR